MSDNDRIQFYISSLAPIFRMEDMDLLDYASTLLRIGSIGDSGWDSLQESRDMMEDLIHFNQMDFPKEIFPDFEKTHWRLHLLSYVHLTEMNAPYNILGNLLRVKAKSKYIVDPFKKLLKFRLKKLKASGMIIEDEKSLNPSPIQKIGEIKRLSQKANLSSVGTIFDDFYFPGLRNAIAHSDYVLSDSFHMVHNQIPDPKNSKQLTSSLSYDELGEILSKTYDYYSAFFTLEGLARAEFSVLKGKCIPYDKNLKGMIEFLIGGDDRLKGIQMHWPNHTDSEYRRTQNGCKLFHIDVNEDGTLYFNPGRRYKNHHDFSPLLKPGQKIHYSPAHRAKKPPEWPGK